MVEFSIDKRYQHLRLKPALQRAAEAALRHQKARSGTQLGLKLTGDKNLQTLNARFLGHDYVTDVLSFPSGDGSAYLGDLAISLPRARAQAKAGGHNLREELQLLTVHGVLHLCGHDHAAPAEKKRMWRAQDEILNLLGVHISAADAERAYSK